MGDPPRPQFMPPPQQKPTSANPNFNMLYYSMVVIGTAVVVLVLYNLIIIRWNVNSTNQRLGRGASRDTDAGATTSRNLNNLNMYRFIYNKKGGEEGDSECAVCLSVFEEGEDVGQLPNCKHCFHGPCIDMWLYSHMDCPLCRSPAFIRHRVASEQPEEHSQEGLLGAAALV